ncbi:hypothetical protein BJ166DRAFT_318722 [Pestalotiopsis sp. NC0098]|nr:hypothetical protein BJ166DRAFT_318722 [Pestalotiopsis sp. NC0098]
MYRHPVADRGHTRSFRTFHNGPRPMRNPPRRRSNRTTQITLEPRPFQELHQEREELLCALNAEDDRALALYQRLVYCDDKIKSFKRNHRRDGTKREQQWVRRRMEESIEAQRAILARLSEVYIEIQSRERWGAVWGDRIVEGRGGCSRWGWEAPAEWSRPTSRGS